MKAWVPRLLTIAVAVAGIYLALCLVTGNLRLKSHAVNAKRPVSAVPKTVPHESLFDYLSQWAEERCQSQRNPVLF